MGVSFRDFMGIEPAAPKKPVVPRAASFDEFNSVAADPGRNIDLHEPTKAAPTPKTIEGPGPYAKDVEKFFQDGRSERGTLTTPRLSSSGPSALLFRVSDSSSVNVLPMVGANGQSLTQEQALEQFRKTGAHYGTFNDEANAKAFTDSFFPKGVPRAARPSSALTDALRPGTTVADVFDQTPGERRRSGIVRPDATETPQARPADRGMSPAEAAGLDPSHLPGRVVNVLGDMAGHPLKTAEGMIMAPIHAAKIIATAVAENEARMALAQGGGDPESVKFTHTPKEVAIAAVQLGSLALGPEIEALVGRAVAPVIGTVANRIGIPAAEAAGKVAAVGTRAAVGAGAGAAFAPDDPVVGAIVGGGLAGAHAVASGAQMRPRIIEDVRRGVEMPALQSGARATNASAKADVPPAPVAPDYVPETVEQTLAKARTAAGAPSTASIVDDAVKQADEIAGQKTPGTALAKIKAAVASSTPDALDSSHAPAPAVPQAPSEPLRAPTARAGDVRFPARVEGLAAAGASAAQTSPQDRQAVAGPVGADSRVHLSDGTEFGVRYRVIDANDLTTSHDPLTFNVDPRYPTGVQGREYAGSRGAGARQHVEMQTGQLRPGVLLDYGGGVTDGPPVVTPDGFAVAGNQRGMMLRRATSMAPESFARYKAELLSRAKQFGVDPATVEGMERPVLVREITDPAINTSDPKELARLNQVSDATATKAKDALSAAAGRASAMKAAGESLAHFTETVGPDESVRDYLGTANGTTFVRKLFADGVFNAQERSAIIGPTGALTTQGKDAVEAALRVAAIGDPDVIHRAPASIVNKLDHALPAIVRTNTAGDYSLEKRIQAVLDLHARVATQKAEMQAKGESTSGFGVQSFANQRDMFAGEEPADVVQLAKFLEQSTRASVTRLFRAWADFAHEAFQQSQFGAQPMSPREIQESAIARTKIADESGKGGPVSRGEFEATDAGKVAEERGTFESGEPKLSGLHNLTEHNLIAADRLGGFPAPSLAVVPEHHQFDKFGPITLIGKFPTFDPAREPVFEVDAYTGRAPQPTYKGATYKQAVATVAPLRSTYERFDAVGELHQVMDIIQDGRFEDAIADIERSIPGRAAFLESVGVRVEPVMGNKPLSRFGDLSKTAALRTFFTEHGSDAHAYDDAGYVATFTKAVAEAINELHPDDAVMRRAARKLLVDNGQVPFGYWDRFRDDARELASPSPKEVEIIPTREAIEDAIKPYPQSTVAAWARSVVEPLMKHPRLKVGRTMEPYNLESATDVATRGRTAGAEQTMTFGPGNARAIVAARFGDITHARNASYQIKTPDEVAALVENLAPEAQKWRDEVLEFWPHGTWEGLDAAYRAVAGYLKQRPAPQAKAVIMGNALRKEGFRGLTRAAIDASVEMAGKVSSMPVGYFEAKPQRAVRFDEFAGAVIPKDAGQTTRDILARRDIPFREYDGTDDRTKVVSEFRRELHDRGHDVLREPRAEYDTSQRDTPSPYGGRNFYSRLELRAKIQNEGQSVWERGQKYAAQLDAFSVSTDGGEPKPVTDSPSEKDTAVTVVNERVINAILKRIDKAGLPRADVRARQIESAQQIGMVSPIGRRMVTLEEKGSIMQAFRNPSVEIVHVFGKDAAGHVVSDFAITAGLINSAHLPRESLVAAITEAKAAGAVSLELGHNQPSGISTPSKDDYAFTHWADGVAGEHGLKINSHTVINHDTAVVFTIDSARLTFESRTVSLTPADAPWTTALEAGFPTVRSTEDIAHYVAKVHHPSGITASYLDTQGGIVAVEPRMADAVDSLAEWLPTSMEAHGAASVVVGLSHEAARALAAVLRGTPAPWANDVHILGVGPQLHQWREYGTRPVTGRRPEPAPHSARVRPGETPRGAIRAARDLQSEAGRGVDVDRGRARGDAGRVPAANGVAERERGQGGETLTGVAMRRNRDGRVFSKDGFDGGHGSIWDRIQGEPGASWRDRETKYTDGFITSSGRFVNRADGLEIAKASRQWNGRNRGKKEPDGRPGIFTEAIDHPDSNIVREPDLFGNETADDARQEGLFGDQAGTAESRNLAQQERAARSELDKLRAQSAGASAVEKIKLARPIAELERFLNRDRVIGADEIATRARGETGTFGADEPGQGMLFERGPDLFGDAPIEDVDAVGIKNSESAKTRNALGMDERAYQEPRTQDDMYAAGKRAAKSDPNAIADLMAALRQDPERIVGSEKEAGLLLMHRVNLEATLQDLLERRGQYEKDGNADGAETTALQLAKARNDIREFVALVERTGTATARALAARKMMSDLDYTLSTMEATTEAAKGAELTRQELDRVRKLHAELQTKLKAVEADAKDARERAAKAESSIAHANLLLEAIGPQSDRIQKALESAAGAARRRIKERGLRAMAGMDPVELADHAIVGAAELAKGITKFGEWASAMRSMMGRGVDEHLDEIFDASTKHLSKVVDKEVPKQRTPAAPKAPRAPKEKTAETMLKAMGERLNEGDQLDDIRPYLRELALAHIRDGITGRDALFARLTEDVRGFLPDVTRTEVRDVLSGYGKFVPLDRRADKTTLRDITAASQKLAQLEALEKKQAPLATGFERQAPSDEVRRLTKAVNEAKKAAGIVTGPDAASRLKTALEANKTRLRNSIRDLQVEIDTGSRIVKGKRASITDPELEHLRTHLKALREAEKKLFGGPQRAPMTDAQRVKAAISAARTVAAAWEARLTAARSGNFTAPAKRGPVASPELDVIRAKTKAAHEAFNELKANDPDEQANENAQRNIAARARIADKEADLRDRMARNDYSKPNVRAGMIPDRETLKRKADLERTQQEFREMQHAFDQKHKSRVERTREGVAQWARASALSWPTVFEKLASAAMARTLLTPITDLVALGVANALPALAKGAPRYGTRSLATMLRAEAKAQVAMWTDGMRDAGQNVRNRKTDLELVYGGHRLPNAWYEYFGSLHAASKAPVKRAELERSLYRRTEAALLAGEDTTDSLVQLRLGTEAYQDAQGVIFMQDSPFVSRYQRFIRSLDERDKKTGKPNLWLQTFALGARVQMPIVKVPVNIIREVSEGISGSLVGPARAAWAYHKGIEDLAPAERDSIIRMISRGLIGAAFLALGFYKYKNFGGHYEPGEKRGPEEIPAGAARVGGHTINKRLLHNPYMDIAQTGATIRKVAETRIKPPVPDSATPFERRQLREQPGEETGYPQAFLAGSLGLIREIPFSRQVTDLAEMMDPRKTRQMLEREAATLLVPGIVQWAASATDDTKRKPKGMIQNIEYGIPGLRQQVPPDAKAGRDSVLAKIRRGVIDPDDLYDMEQRHEITSSDRKSIINQLRAARRAAVDSAP